MKLVIEPEWGRDEVPGEGTEGQPGWKLQGVSWETYRGEIVTGDGELRKDGAFGLLYTVGAYATPNNPPDFSQFNLDDQAAEIATLGLTNTGPHVHRVMNDGVRAWIRAAPIVKALDDPYPLLIARDDAWRVFRATLDQGPHEMSAETAAAIFLGKLGVHRHPRLIAELWVGIPPADKVTHAAKLEAVAAILLAAGVKLICGPGWYTGNGEPGDVPPFAFVDVLANQGYWGNKGLTPWNALRYRTLFPDALRAPPANIPPKPAPVDTPAPTSRPAPAAPPKKEQPMRDMRGKLPTLQGNWTQLAYHSRPVSGIVGATLHYTAGPASQTAEQIAAYQTSPAAAQQTGADQPFPGIAYTVTVIEDGTAVICHDLATRTWHSAAVVDGVKWNAARMGIVYTGKGRPNAAQVRGIATAIRWGELQQSLGREWSIDGHKDQMATSCPPEWPAWRGEVERELAKLRGGTMPDPIEPQLETNVLAPLFKAQDWLAKNAKTERQREYQRQILFAFRDMKGEIPV